MIIRENVAARVNHKTRARAFDWNRFHEHIIFQRSRDDVGHSRRSLAVDLYGEHFVADEFVALGLRKRSWHCFDVYRLALAPAAPRPIRSQHEYQAQRQQTDYAALTFSCGHFE